MSNLNKIKVECIFCRCIISIKNGDKNRFNDHMNNEHDARFDFDVLMTVTTMTEGERRKLVRDNAAKVLERITPKNQQKKVDQNDEKESAEDEKIIITDSEDDEEEVIEKVKQASPVKKVLREGILKCKICFKYFKQSLMEEHKRTEHFEELNNIQQTETPMNPEASDEHLLKEHSDSIKDSMKQMIRNIRKRKPSVDDSEKDDDVDDDDEDWTETKEKRKKVVWTRCSFCKKRFGSKLSLTQHERMAHKKKIL